MIDITKIKNGDVLSEHQFYQVVRKDNMRRMFILKNDAGEELSVADEIVRRDMDSADIVESTLEFTRTDLINMVKSNPHVAMTIHFRKQVDMKTVKTDLYELYSNKKGKLISEKEYKERVNAIIDGSLLGEERTMRGRHSIHFDEFSRLQFVDMDIERDFSKSYDNRLRKVDLRTIEWAIIKNIKYIVK